MARTDLVDMITHTLLTQAKPFRVSDIEEEVLKKAGNSDDQPPMTELKAIVSNLCEDVFAQFKASGCIRHVDKGYYKMSVGFPACA